MPRTAVIAGAVTATSRAVSGSMEHSAQQKQMAAEQQQMLAQLQQLARLKESGILSDEEFRAVKAKLLGL